MFRANLSTLIAEALADEKRRLDRFDPECQFAHYHETHLAHAIANALGSRGYVTVLQARCPAYGKDLCDLYACKHRTEVWGEIKRGWHGVGERWNSKPADQLRSWLKDIRKLNRIDNGVRFFVLLHYRQKRLLRPGWPDARAVAEFGSLASDLVNNLRGTEPFTLPARYTAYEVEAILAATLTHLTGRLVLPNAGLTTERDEYEYHLYASEL